MNRISKSKSLFICGLFFMTASLGFAGDSNVEVNIEQDIKADAVNVSSDEGDASTSVGSVQASEGSNLEADVKSEIEVKNVSADTKGGKASSNIGSVQVGN